MKTQAPTGAVLTCPNCGGAPTLYYQRTNNAIRAQCDPCGRFVTFPPHSIIEGRPDSLPEWPGGGSGGGATGAPINQIGLFGSKP